MVGRFVTVRLALTSLFAAALMVTTGCLESMEHITLRPDGSGTVTLTVNVDNAQAKQLKEMLETYKSMQGEGMGGMGGMGGGGQMPDIEGITSLLNDLNPATVIAKVKGKKGLKVIAHSSKTDKEKNKTHHRVVIGFDKLQSYYGSGVVDNLRMSLTKGEDGSFTLTRSLVMPGMTEETLATKEGKEMLETAKGMTALAQDALKGFQGSFALEAPGKISKTNGTRAESGNGVGWTVDLESMFEPGNWKQSATFAGSDLKLEPFSLTAKQISDAAAAARKEIEKAAKEAKDAAKTGEEAAKKAADEAAKADEAAEEAAKKAKEALKPVGK